MHSDPLTVEPREPAPKRVQRVNSIILGEAFKNGFTEDSLLNVLVEMSPESPHYEEDVKTLLSHWVILKTPSTVENPTLPFDARTRHRQACEEISVQLAVRGYENIPEKLVRLLETTQDYVPPVQQSFVDERPKSQPRQPQQQPQPQAAPVFEVVISDDDDDPEQQALPLLVDHPAAKRRALIIGGLSSAELKRFDKATLKEFKAFKTAYAKAAKNPAKLAQFIIRDCENSAEWINTLVAVQGIDNETVCQKPFDVHFSEYDILNEFVDTTKKNLSAKPDRINEIKIHTKRDSYVKLFFKKPIQDDGYHNALHILEDYYKKRFIHPKRHHIQSIKAFLEAEATQADKTLNGLQQRLTDWIEDSEHQMELNPEGSLFRRKEFIDHLQPRMSV